MIDEAYDQGVRAICLTPHWYPVSFGYNSEKALAAFDLVKSYILAKKVKMYLFLGNELRYSNGAADWLRDGSCRRLNRTRFVLVDFSSGERCEDMIDGVRNILNIGHKPVFAHIERYQDIGKDLRCTLSRECSRRSLSAAYVVIYLLDGSAGFCARRG